MNEISKDINEKPDFRNLYPDYSDDEILKILRKRKYYQKEAADFALQEAIKRNLISSEQDLFASEFNSFTLNRSWFPKIEKVRNRVKIQKSIARILLLAGIFPLVWGILNVNKGNLLEGTGLMIGGVLWLYFSAMLNRKVNNSFLRALFVLLVLGMVYLGLILQRSSEPVIMDFFIPAVLCGLIVYGLLFLYRLKS